MIRRISAVAALASLAVAAPAFAAPKANTITAIGGMKVKANAYVQDDQRWDANKYSVKSGATVTLRDKSTMGQPHSLSLIKKLPKGDQAIMECKECGPLMEAHGADPESMEAKTELVEAGGEGFDTAGDSIWLPAKGKVTFEVTAKAGTKLAFVCAIHPWMLGEITVK
ncbi:hypothetical protein DVA67_022650 [Solirubrobacter sp. CPCC 204708]|uniref:Copper-binding protein n=1 Tax=Solirubrobacter deserti TaxID=2282478 RepID=A0ABT4RHZ4_9ACTN|nr:hypothetical protein [Solirubrobacter deserti]MBE2318793.1 hypothetical protein [Solirubrobacter deserti]MDA0138173.1 hypothetical protein [Solirubrobacter deserti]